MAEKFDAWDSYGDDSPVNDEVLAYYCETGNRRQNTNPVTLAMGLIGWACTVAGHPGTWVEIWGSGTAGAIILVDNVAALRLLPASRLHVDRLYGTRGYTTAGDGGGQLYEWKPLDVTTDDGVLFFKAVPLTGRLKASDLGAQQGMFNALAAGFDKTGVTALGTNLKFVTGILAAAGWAGIYFPDGTYLCNGNEQIAPRTRPGIGFTMRGSGMATLTGPNLEASASTQFGVYGYGEYDVGAPTPTLIAAGYTARTWTQTILGSERTLGPGIPTTGLAVGDVMMVRLGADTTDADGWCYSWYLAEIKTISATPTGSITFRQSAPEVLPSSAGLNLVRTTQTQHDMIKMTGFQDNTVIEGFRVNNVFFGPQVCRDLTIDVDYKRATFALQPYACSNLRIPSLRAERITGVSVGSGIGAFAHYGAFITLHSCYNTWIGNVVVDELDGVAFLSEELSCRGTRVDLADVTYNSIDGIAFSSPLIAQSAGATNIISFGHLVLRGGYAQATFAPRVAIDVFEDRGANDAQTISLRADSVGNKLFYRDKGYTGRRAFDQIFPIGPSATHYCRLPQKGLIRRLRVKCSSVTGITSFHVSGDNFLITDYDVTSSITAGTWRELGPASLLAVGAPNYLGYADPLLRVTCGASTPVGAVIEVEVEMFVLDTDGANVLTGETSIGRIVSGVGDPTANAYHIGQEYFDSTNGRWWRAKNVGTGATDWDRASTTYTGGAGISVVGTVISNTGVLSITAGTNIAVTGTASVPIISATGLVTSVTAGTGITLTGTSTAPIVNSNLSTGIAGGQPAYGGTAASEVLTLYGSTHATNGLVRIAGVGNLFTSESLEIATGNVHFNSAVAQAVKKSGGGNLFVGVSTNDELNLYANGGSTFIAISSTRCDFSALIAGGLVKSAITTGRLSNAVAGTDYLLGVTAGTGITFTGTAANPTINSDLSTGVAGGQTAYGGTVATNALTLRGSAHASNGPVNITGVAAATSLSIGLGNIVFGAAAVQSIQKTSGPLDFGTLGNSTVQIYANAGSPSIWLNVGGAGGVDITTLTAGGIVSAAVTTGRLGIAVAGTAYVVSVAAGTGISVTGAGGVLTVANTGVLSVTAGTNVSVTGTATAPIVNVTGVVTSVTAGTNVSVTGTATVPIINVTGVVTSIIAGAGISVSGTTAVTVTNTLATGLGTNQNVYGGVNASNTLTLYGTAHATNGPVVIAGMAAASFTNDSLRVASANLAFTSNVYQVIQKKNGGTLYIGNESTTGADELYLYANGGSDYMIFSGTRCDFSKLTGGGMVTAAVSTGRLGVQAFSGSQLAGRGSASGVGAPEPINLGTGLSISGTTISVSGVVTSIIAGTGISVSGTTAVTVTSTLATGLGSSQSVYGGTSAGNALNIYGSVHASNGPVNFPGVSAGTSLDIKLGNTHFTANANQGLHKYVGGDLTVGSLVTGGSTQMFVSTGANINLSSAGCDVSYLSAGGIVSAAVTTGRLGLVTIGTGLLFSGGTLSATGGSGTVTAVTATSPIVSSGGTAPNITHATSGVTAGTYANPAALVVNGTGHITSISTELPKREYQYVFAAPVNSMATNTYISTNTADATTWGVNGPWYQSSFASANIRLLFYVTQSQLFGSFAIDVMKNNASSIASAITISAGDTGKKDSGTLSLSLDGSTDTWGLVLISSTAASGALWISGVAILG